MFQFTVAIFITYTCHKAQENLFSLIFSSLYNSVTQLLSVCSSVGLDGCYYRHVYTLYSTIFLVFVFASNYVFRAHMRASAVTM
jgi:hypothetical protein